MRNKEMKKTTRNLKNSKKREMGSILGLIKDIERDSIP